MGTIESERKVDVKNKVMTIIVKDVDGKEHVLLSNYDDWKRQKEWYAYREALLIATAFGKYKITSDFKTAFVNKYPQFKKFIENELEK